MQASKYPQCLVQTDPLPYFYKSLKNISRSIPWHDGKEIHDDTMNHHIVENLGLIIKEFLSEGTFSKVYKGFWDTFKIQVAVKIIEKKEHQSLHEHSFNVLSLIPDELHALQQLKHPNVVRFFGAIETHLRVHMIFELLEEGDLLQYIHKYGKQSMEKGRKWFAQLVNAVKFIHDFHIAHRDIKCENILLSYDGGIRLADFGFAKHNIPWIEDIPNSEWLKCEVIYGSDCYMSPEMLAGERYSPLLGDVWAMGVVLYAVLTCKFPSPGIVFEDWEKEKVLFSHGTGGEDDVTSHSVQGVFARIFVPEKVRIRSYELLDLEWISQNREELFIGHFGRFPPIKEENIKEEEEMLGESLFNTKMNPYDPEFKPLYADIPDCY